MRLRIGISLLSAAMISGCTINIVPAQHSGVTPTRVVHAPAPATTTRITQTYQSQTTTQTSLYLLVVRGDQAAVTQQLQQGADPNQFGDDPAHGPRTPLCVAVRNRNYTLTRLLLDAGANPNLSCHYQGSQETPLLAAASLGNTWLVTQLLNKGADPHYRNPNGQTPYLLANQGHHRAVMDKLVAAGVTPTANGQSASAPAQTATTTRPDHRDEDRQHKHDKKDQAKQDKADKRNAREQRAQNDIAHDDKADNHRGGRDHNVTPAASATGQAHASDQSRLNRDTAETSATDEATAARSDTPPAVTAKPSRGQEKETATYTRPGAATSANRGHANAGKVDNAPTPAAPPRAAGHSSAAAERVAETPAATVVTPDTRKPVDADDAKATEKADKQEKTDNAAADEARKDKKKDKNSRD